MAQKKSPPPAEEFEVDLDADAWAAEEAGAPGIVSRLSAEFIGTFVFMFVGLGATLFGLLMSATSALRNPGDIPGIAAQSAQWNLAAGLTSALVWGVALLALVVAFGRVSGAHFNPAVTLGAWIAGRFPGRDVALYILVQTAGAISGASLVAWLAKGFPLLDPSNTVYLDNASLQAPQVGEAMSLVAVGSGDHSPAGLGLRYGLVVEFVAVALLVGIILAATSVRAPRGQAAVSIGLGFGVLTLLTYPLTGGGLNPARVTATTLLSKTADGDFWGFWGLGDLGWWWLVMLMAGAFVGLLIRAFGPEEDLEIVEIIEVEE
jgi:aquaporin Z